MNTYSPSEPIERQQRAHLQATVIGNILIAGVCLVVLFTIPDVRVSLLILIAFPVIFNVGLWWLMRAGVEHVLEQTHHAAPATVQERDARRSAEARRAQMLSRRFALRGNRIDTESEVLHERHKDRHHLTESAPHSVANRAGERLSWAKLTRVGKRKDT